MVRSESGTKRRSCRAVCRGPSPPAWWPWVWRHPPPLVGIARAVEVSAERLRAGGRLHYFGAGTSGRIAALDAAECPATFGISADLVQAHEGGDDDQEDDEHRGRDHAERAGMRAGD